MTTHIFHGPWVNFGHGGPITGATLTLSERSGGLLTSFIAAFVTLVGAQLWKVLSFAIHQVRSTTEPRDGLFHQQQVIWRNAAGPGGAAWTLAQQMWHWRNKASQSFLRTVCWTLFSVAYLIAFGLAAVFSSEISKSPGSERLIVGQLCGFWYPHQDTDGVLALNQKMTNDSQVSASYARACYNGGENLLQCGRYPTASIKWDVNSNATCPFASGMCIYGDTAAYQMTSHLIDSQHDLGINTPANERLQIQKRTTCAPLHEKGYVNVSTVTLDNGDGTYENRTFWQLMYGVFDYDNGTVSMDFTAFVNTASMFVGVGYQVNSVFHSSNDSTIVGWHPIPELNRKDADVTLVFLSPNSVRYDYPVDDPWYGAHYTDNTTDWYLSDEYITTLGCAEQYRFCNPNNNVCTDYQGSDQLINSLAKQAPSIAHMQLSDMQQLVATRLNYAADWSSVYHMTYTRGPMSLRAQETLTQLSQVSLPNNQWQIEVSSWFDGGLAAVQQHALEFATGPSLMLPGAYLWTQANITNQTEASLFEFMCSNQLINDSSDTMSFSILGLTILFVVGSVIILVSLVVDRVVAQVQSWFRVNLHGRRAWLLDDKLQLHRTVFDKAGMGRWHEDEDSAVPVTAYKEKFSRFAADAAVHSPNNPDGLEYTSHLFQKTDYKGQYGMVPNPNIYNTGPIYTYLPQGNQPMYQQH